MKAVRLQRKRQKGFKLISPNGLPIVCVTRPSKWGNPFKVGDEVPKHWLSNTFSFNNTDTDYMENHICNLDDILNLYRKWIKSQNLPIKELKNKNLACFCSLDKNCHADILLELSNI